MAYSSIPANPAYRARWDGWMNGVADNVRELIADVPTLKTQVTQATTRVSQAETAITALQNASASTASTASTALSTAQTAATSAASASTAAQTAQSAASQAASDAAASASQVSGLSTTVGAHTTQIATLTSGKADMAALATVALTGKWADLIGAPTSSGGAATTLASTAFTGAANGAAWPAPWTTGQAPTGGSVTVQSERGQLVTGTNAGNYSSAAGTSVRWADQAADVEVVFTFRRVSNVHMRFVLRTGSASLNPADGVVVGLEGAKLAVSSVASYTYTEVAAAAKAWNTGVDYRVRVKAAGTTVQARSWLATDTEPAAWDVTATVTRTTAGHFGFWAGTDAAAASQTAQVDDIAVTLPGASSGTGGAAETVTADLTAIYTAAKA